MLYPYYWIYFSTETLNRSLVSIWVICTALIVFIIRLYTHITILFLCSSNQQNQSQNNFYTKDWFVNRLSLWPMRSFALEVNTEFIFHPVGYLYVCLSLSFSLWVCVCVCAYTVVFFSIIGNWCGRACLCVCDYFSFHFMLITSGTENLKKDG